MPSDHAMTFGQTCTQLYESLQPIISDVRQQDRVQCRGTSTTTTTTTTTSTTVLARRLEIDYQA